MDDPTSHSQSRPAWEPALPSSYHWLLTTLSEHAGLRHLTRGTRLCRPGVGTLRYSHVQAHTASDVCVLSPHRDRECAHPRLL